MAADRAQIRATILDADLSEVWLRAKVHQLLDCADELEAERDALREENERLRNAFALAEPSLEARTDFYRQAKARPEEERA